MTRISVVLCSALILLPAAQAQTQALDTAKAQFQARCSGCHGDDGTGGGHGPNIIDVRRPRATSAEAVRELIRKGIPEAGMPAFPLPAAELDNITAYVMTLKTPAGAPRTITGDFGP